MRPVRVGVVSPKTPRTPRADEPTFRRSDNFAHWDDIDVLILAANYIGGTGSRNRAKEVGNTSDACSQTAFSFASIDVIGRCISGGIYHCRDGTTADRKHALRRQARPDGARAVRLVRDNFS